MRRVSGWTLERVPLTTLASGAEVALVLHELRGAGGDGPTLGLSAAIHGDEAVGVEILYQLRRRLDPAALRGRVVLLPCANPLAYQAGTRHTPLDMANLNRVFPGDPGGWFTEQLADLIARRFLAGLDAYVDLHSGGAFPTVDYVYVFNDERLSRSFGSRFLYRPAEPFPGTAAGTVAARGRPAMVVELGGGDVDQQEYVERGVRGLLETMRALGMLPGPPAPRPRQVLLTELTTLRPRAGGLLLPEVTALGEELGPGAVLGRVVHPQTFAELEALRAPHRRSVTILVHRTADVVEPGSYGYMIGNLETAVVDP
jgi:predicted deacylase